MPRGKYKRFRLIKGDTGLDDPGIISALDLIGFAEQLIKKHGLKVHLRFDAGWNHISVDALYPSRGKSSRNLRIK